ncbi:MAG: hypothetical protein ACFCD0_12855 [Gemmataceae bacterium]
MMTGVRINAAIVFTLLAFVVPASGQTDPKVFQKLETAIPEGIRMLEAKKYEPFLKNFVPPELYKKITSKITPQKFSQEFAKRNAPRLLQVLKEIKGKTPTYSNEGMRATYELTAPIAGKKSISFNKINNHWYVKN